MFPMVIPNSTSFTDEASNSSGARIQFGTFNTSMLLQNPNVVVPAPKAKKKRNIPGNPDPEAEVIALSPTTLMTANRFVCEVCQKGFQRDQNLQLHRRGHNLPWKLKQRNNMDNKKRAYVCPEPTCIHHHPSRALGDLTGIKKHFCRKHGEKKWKCDKCSKFYALQSDWKAHTKTCGTREYRCDCRTLFSRKDSFITHRAFCDAFDAKTTKLTEGKSSIMEPNPNFTIAPSLTPTPTQPYLFNHQNLLSPLALLPFSSHPRQLLSPWDQPESPSLAPQNINPNLSSHADNQAQLKHHSLSDIPSLSSSVFQDRSIPSPFGSFQVSHSVPPLSATALLQKAATMGASTMGHMGSTMSELDMHVSSTWHKTDGLTRDFLGLTGDQCGGNGSGSGLKFFVVPYDGVHGFGFTEPCPGWGNSQ